MTADNDSVLWQVCRDVVGWKTVSSFDDELIRFCSREQAERIARLLNAKDRHIGRLESSARNMDERYNNDISMRDMEIDRLQVKVNGLEILWEDALKRLIGLDMITRELDVVNKRWEFLKKSLLVMSETETKRHLRALIEAAEIRIIDK